MRYIFSLVLLTIYLPVFGQKMPEQSIYKVRLTLPDKTVVAETDPVSITHFNSALLYYWYYADAIHTSQGGYSGKLLNGSYMEYYPDKNLKEQGYFKKGLKDGDWKSWDDSGKIISETNWKNGIDITGNKPPIWKRFHLFKKRPKAPADSSKNVN
jgi:MORN repeat protein